MKKKLVSLAVAGSLGTLGMAVTTVLTAAPAHATCPASSSPGTTGPYYSQPGGSSGYVGVGGNGGYIAANGSSGPPPSGYILASNGTSGGAVTSSGACQC